MLNEWENNVTSCTNCLYLISTFIPLDVDNFGGNFYLFLFVTEKNPNQTISRCQERHTRNKSETDKSYTCTFSYEI